MTSRSLSALLPGLVAAALTHQIARAHDIPDERVDRGIQVDLEPPGVRIAYEVSLSEWTLYQDLKRLASDLPPGDLDDWVARYSRIVAPLNSRGLLATIDGRELEWRIDRVEVDFDRHPRLTFHFHAAIPASGRFVLRDTNYVSSYGTSRLALRAASGTRVAGYEGPEALDAIPERPSWALTDEEELGTRQVDVAFGPADDLSGLSRATGAKSGERPAGTRTTRGSASRKGSEERLTRLFWSSSGHSWAFLLVAAFVIGAAHAIQPGHGKTVVIGASIQGPRPIGRGLLLAGSAAGAHFLLAIGLAAVVMVLVPGGFDRIDSTATRGVGLVIGMIGAWRVGAAIRGPTEERILRGRRVDSSNDAIATGLAIGLIPCWDAVLLLALSWIAGQAVLGIALLIAFSLGASATLLGVALAAGLFRTLAGRLTSSPILERTLGTAGGLLLAGIGAYLFLA